MREQVKTSLYNAPKLPCRGHVQMTVTAVGDDGLIYARTEELGTQWTLPAVVLLEDPDVTLLMLFHQQ